MQDSRDDVCRLEQPMMALLAGTHYNSDVSTKPWRQYQVNKLDQIGFERSSLRFTATVSGTIAHHKRVGCKIQIANFEINFPFFFSKAASFIIFDDLGKLMVFSFAGVTCSVSSLERTQKRSAEAAFIYFIYCVCVCVRWLVRACVYLQVFNLRNCGRVSFCRNSWIVEANIVRSINLQETFSNKFCLCGKILADAINSDFVNKSNFSGTITNNNIIITS